MKQKYKIKIAYIGGGSRGWAHKLMGDLTLCPHLTGQLALYDIDRPMALLNARVGRKLNESTQAKTVWKYTVPKTLAQALDGADFVLASIQPGPIELMQPDLEIPQKYGILHTVGDTTGPAGLCRALRAVPEYVAIAKAVRKYCPDAWVFNYTNPMAVCTRTLYTVFPQIKALGCCHEVFGTQNMLANLVKQAYGHKPGRDAIRVNILGVNHFTWIDRATYEDIDLLTLYRKHIRRKGVIRRIREEEVAEFGVFHDFGQVTADLLLQYGILPAAGERHLVEFVPFYLTDEKTLHRWGVKCTPYSWRINRYVNAPKESRKRLRGKNPFTIKPSGEEGVRQIMALSGLADLRTNVNLPNVGQLEGITHDAVVETNAWFTADNVKPEISGRLPAGIETLVARAVSNQQMITEAALNRDKKLAFQAFLNDPLTRIPMDQVKDMFNEMLLATKDMLPGWKL